MIVFTNDQLSWFKGTHTIHIKVHVRVIEMLCDFAVLKITLEGVCCAELLWDGKCMIQKEFIHCNITHVSRNKLRSGARDFSESNFRFRFFLKSTGSRELKLLSVCEFFGLQRCLRLEAANRHQNET